MAKTSIHFKACDVIKSELHNSREQKLDYIFPELSENNESMYLNGQNLHDRQKDCIKLYEEKIGQKMQSKTVPLREGVVVIDEKTTMNDLRELAQAITDELGWECLQIHIHRDEGYILSGDNKGGAEVAKLNLHAHLIFDCQDKQTGKMFRNNKRQMSKVQDICAEILQMERGQKSGRKHLSAIDWKIQEQTERLLQITAEVQNALEEKNNVQKEFLERKYELHQKLVNYKIDQMLALEKELEPLKNQKQQLQNDIQTLKNTIDTELEAYRNNKFTENHALDRAELIDFFVRKNAELLPEDKKTIAYMQEDLERWGMCFLKEDKGLKAFSEDIKKRDNVKLTVPSEQEHPSRRLKR